MFSWKLWQQKASYNQCLRWRENPNTKPFSRCLISASFYENLTKYALALQTLEWNKKHVLFDKPSQFNCNYLQIYNEFSQIFFMEKN